MYLNKAYLDAPGCNSDMVLNVVAHEFGHALGLAHNQSTDLMDPRIFLDHTTAVSLSRNDKASYDAAYTHY
jgi:predicted Zn-dependent protease